MVSTGSSLGPAKTPSWESKLVGPAQMFLFIIPYGLREKHERVSVVPNETVGPHSYFRLACEFPRDTCDFPRFKFLSYPILVV